LETLQALVLARSANKISIPHQVVNLPYSKQKGKHHESIIGKYIEPFDRRDWKHYKLWFWQEVLG